MTDLTPAQAAAAEQERLDDEREELICAVEGAFAREDYDEIRAALVAPLAAIRRHAAAQALREQATRLRKVGAMHREQAEVFQNDARRSTTCAHYAEQALRDARALDSAAYDVIAEGWEFTCAQSTPATREDPAEGCEEPVEHEGDTCPRHESSDDYDRSEEG